MYVCKPKKHKWHYMTRPSSVCVWEGAGGRGVYHSIYVCVTVWWDVGEMGHLSPPA